MSFCTGAYPCLSKLNVSLKLRGGCVWLGVMLLHRRRAIIWYVFGVARVNSTGGGVVVKFGVFLQSYAVCLCCLHASNDPLC